MRTITVELTNEQRSAIDLVLGLAGSPGPPRLALLTGGPGTGKTTTLRALLDELERRGISAALAAPSGKAAQRMVESTGREASTLHRLLGLRPDGPEGERAIERDVLIVDESSMVDVPLCAAAIRAAQSGSVRVILLVGDADQIPPVGPGQPFQDLLAARQIPSVRLTEVHRQAAESGIIQAAYSVIQGRAPSLEGHDISLVEVPEATDVPAAIWELVQEHSLDPETSQILAPQRPGPAGVTALNDYVERARWPDGPALLRDQFRAGTKVIHTKNNYELEVFNGELGQVLRALPGKAARGDEACVRIAGAERVYSGAVLKQLSPAWALTVHKSQGSEWDNVIVVAHPSQRYMLTRRLLYVALTRAKSRVWVVGTHEAVGLAAKNVRDAKRDTWLSGRLARDARSAAGARP